MHSDFYIMFGEIIILTGAPGAGKSTVAGLLARSFAKGVHLHSDDYWHYIVSGGIPPYLEESHDQNETVMEAIAATAREYAIGKFAVVVDGIVGPWMLDHFRSPKNEVQSVRTHYIVLRPSEDEALARATARSGKRDLVEEAPVVSLWQQFADLGSLESHVIDNTHQSASETLESVRVAVNSGRCLLQ